MARGLTPLKIRAKKDLHDSTGEQCFTMGRYYETDGYINYHGNISETVVVLNDNGDKHQLGNWYKHFKTVK